MPLLLKGLASAVIIVALSELTRRYAVLSGLPGCYAPHHSSGHPVGLCRHQRRGHHCQVLPVRVVGAHSHGPLLCALVMALKKGLSFWPALGFSMVLWMAGAVIHLWLLSG